jgi:hypothetical protein
MYIHDSPTFCTWLNPLPLTVRRAHLICVTALASVTKEGVLGDEWLGCLGV